MEELYIKSVEELREKLKENQNITMDEWNSYAKKNNLLSGITLLARDNENTWEEYKVNCIKKRNKILRRISKSISKKDSD